MSRIICYLLFALAIPCTSWGVSSCPGVPLCTNDLPQGSMCVANSYSCNGSACADGDIVVIKGSEGTSTLVGSLPYPLYRSDLGFLFIRSGTTSTVRRYSASPVDSCDPEPCDIVGLWTLNQDQTAWECVDQTCNPGAVVDESNCDGTPDPAHCFNGVYDEYDPESNIRELGIDCELNCSAECMALCPPGSEYKNIYDPFLPSWTSQTQEGCWYTTETMAYGNCPTGYRLALEYNPGEDLCVKQASEVALVAPTVEDYPYEYESQPPSPSGGLAGVIESTNINDIDNGDGTRTKTITSTSTSSNNLNNSTTTTTKTTNITYDADTGEEISRTEETETEIPPEENPYNYDTDFGISTWNDNESWLPEEEDIPWLFDTWLSDSPFGVFINETRLELVNQSACLDFEIYEKHIQFCFDDPALVPSYAIWKQMFVTIATLSGFFYLVRRGG